MQSQVVILSGGRDAHILHVRNEVLKLPGYTVVSAITPEEVISTFRAGDFDIVLLCHTFSNEEQSHIARAIHATSPSTPVFFVSTGLLRNENDGVTVLNDAPSLLNGVSWAASHPREIAWRRPA